MIKVFLVEDEIIIRNGIKNTIDWEKEGFEFAGEAGDGEVAYPLILKTRPDILITDIQMPFMNGLELSRLIKYELPDTKILILSGYGEFDYAKQAIAIGVTNYLLKPVSSEKLLEELHGISRTIEAERHRNDLLTNYEQNIEEQEQRAREKLYGELVTGTVPVSEALARGCELGVGFRASAYLILIIKLSVLNSEEGNADDWFEQVLRQFPAVKTFPYGIEGYVLIIEGENEHHLDDICRQIEGELQNLRAEQNGVQFFGGIGGAVTRLGDVPKSYYQACKAFANRFFMAWNQLAGLDDQEELPDVKTLGNTGAGRALVTDFLKGGVQEDVEVFTRRYFDTIGEGNYKSLLFRKYIMMDVFMEAVSFLERIGQPVDALSEKSRNISDTIIRAGSQEVIEDYFNTLFRDCLAVRDSIAARKHDQLIENARTYISDHYSDDDLSLNTVASYVGMSSSYFSSLFSQETGQTFIEYVTAVRMEKAKELLMCTSLRTSEIGSRVGYKDPHYFSYLFKKVVSCSPKEYRSRRDGNRG